MQPATRVRDHWGVAFALAWISGINSGVAVALSPALPEIAKAFGRHGDGAFVAQMVQTLPAVAMIAGAALTGYASELWGRRMVILITASAFTISGGAGLFLPDLQTLIFSRVVQGFAAGVLLTASYAAVAEYFTGEARNRMLGFCAGFGSIASIGFLLAGGAMVDAFGWRSVFALYLLELLTLPFVYICMHRDRPARESGEKLSWSPIIAIWPVLLLQILLTIGMYMSVIQIPFIAVQKGIVSGVTISWLVMTTSVVATVVALSYARLLRFLDFSGMLVWTCFFFGAGLLICASAKDFAVMLLGAATLGLAAGAVEPTIMTRTLNHTPEPLHDRAVGAAISGLFLGQFLNPVLVHPVAVIGGINFAAIVYGCLYLAGAATALGAFLRFQRKHDSRMRL